MNLHEYQAKELLKKYNVPVQEGYACSTVHEVEDAYRQIKGQTGSSFAVIKAQIHAGGRGKGKVIETGINGVKVAKSLEEITEFAKKILGGTLVTIQTGPQGKVVIKYSLLRICIMMGQVRAKNFIYLFYWIGAPARM